MTDSQFRFSALVAACRAVPSRVRAFLSAGLSAVVLTKAEAVPVGLLRVSSHGQLRQITPNNGGDTPFMPP